MTRKFFQFKLWQLIMLVFVSLFLANCTKPKPIVITPTAKQPTALSILNCKVVKDDAKKTIDLYPGDGLSEDLLLGVRPTPADASVDDIVWESDSTNVEVDKKTGALKIQKTANPETTAKISVTSKDGKVSDSCTVTIRNKVTHITKLYIVDENGNRLSDDDGSAVAARNLEVQYSFKKQLRVVAEPANASNLTGFVWSSEGNNAISVDPATGVVSVEEKTSSTSNANATIKVTNAGGDVSASATVKPIENQKITELLVDRPVVDFVSTDSNSEQYVFVAIRPDNAFNNELDISLVGKDNALNSNQTTKTNIIKVEKDANNNNKFKITYLGSGNIGDSIEVTFTSKDGSNESVKLTVNIIQKRVAVTGLSITDSSIPALILNPQNYGFLDLSKARFNISTLIEPTGATNKTLIWGSSDDQIVQVIDGQLQAVGEGTATISVVSQDNPNQKASIEVRVKNGVSVTSIDDITYSDGFILYDTEDTGGNGSKNIQTSIQPADATNKNIIWFSTNPDVVTVQPKADSTKATITPVGEGGATTIVAISEDGNFYKKISINTANIGMKKFVLPNSGSISVPVGSSDSDTASVTKNFSMAKTEVVFSLWKEVYDFATKEGKNSSGDPSGQRVADNGSLYKFQSTGNLGNRDPGAPYRLPVAGLNYSDAIVFANAMTEYYNYKKNLTGSNRLTPYYSSGSTDSSIYRNAAGLPNGSLINNSTRNGFRLPTAAEWELMARLTKVSDPNYVVSGRTLRLDGTTYHYLKGDRVSGEAPAIGANSAISIKDLAWYKDTTAPMNSTQYITYPVALKKANEMGIFDMGGNIAEYIYGLTHDSYTGVYKIKVKGGQYDSDEADIKIGVTKDLATGAELPRKNIGLRLVRNID